MIATRTQRTTGRPRAKRALGLLAVLLLTLLPLAPAASAVTPRASLIDIENDVMCTVCKEPLIEAQSPEANTERAFISRLIAQGLDKQQIERQLVAQYGPAVLGKPPAHGFNLTVYVLPPVVLVLGLGVLAVLLPRWRRAARLRASMPFAEGAAVSSADARRLDEELAHFNG